ncbi:hypothetical protein [Arundinibacter roseus]|uniref:DUF2029 domain-containing protein n=1 Tax=Arundinibacter roseus TaxID=2070510 RepID=A0A4R4K7V9_9BACT|nr:hypothetical protein [Arundinibacter roseus]TDB63747.1 hypothetical protein EZE20_15750 [Arundinibacter roseus]
MKKYLAILWILLSAAGYGWLLYGLQRTDTSLLLSLWGALFLLYALAFYYKAEQHFSLFLVAALVFRCVGLWSVPVLSDDVFRFIWDGRLLAQGHNPYMYLPSELVATDIATQAGLTPELFQRLNSPAYYTVYPPLLQLWFWVSTLLTSSESATIFWLRLPLVLGEFASLWLLFQLLQKMGKNKQEVRRGTLLYALNPLVIVELIPNVHYEGLMICFVLACLYFYPNKNKIGSAFFLSLAVGVKLLPLIFLPTLIPKENKFKALIYSSLVGVLVLLPFLFFFDKFIIERFSTSLDLYFRTFEFNASLYYLLRKIGMWILGYNPIATLGPLLSLLSFSTILFLSFGQILPINRYERLLLILTVYLFCATTVHPWYVVPLLALCVLGRFRFPLVWSVLLPLTYTAYQTPVFVEKSWVLVLEYALVWGWLAWELWSNKTRRAAFEE